MIVTNNPLRWLFFILLLPFIFLLGLFWIIPKALLFPILEDCPKFDNFFLKPFDFWFNQLLFIKK